MNGIVKEILCLGDLFYNCTYFSRSVVRLLEVPVTSEKPQTMQGKRYLKATTGSMRKPLT